VKLLSIIAWPEVAVLKQNDKKIFSKKQNFLPTLLIKKTPKGILSGEMFLLCGGVLGSIYRPTLSYVVLFRLR